MNGFLYAIGVALCYTATDFTQKFLVKKIHPVATTLFMTLFTCFFALIWAFFDDFTLIFTPFSIITFLCIGIINVMTLLFLFKGFEKLALGETITIANTSPLFASILVFLAFRETLSLWQILLMLLIFVGIAILSIDEFAAHHAKFLLFPLITALGWGIFAFVIPLLQSFGNSTSGIVVGMHISQLFFLILYMIFWKKPISRSLLQFRSLSIAGFSGLLNMIAVSFFALATQTLSGAIVSSIVTGQVLFATLGGWLFFKEKLGRYEIIGILTMFIGLIGFYLLG